LSYDAWEARGRISLKTCDIVCAIGLFIFGWLIGYVYQRAGKNMLIIIPIIVLYVLGIRLHFAFVVAGIVAYLCAWYYIHMTIKRYQEMYDRESQKESAS